MVKFWLSTAWLALTLLAVPAPATAQAELNLQFNQVASGFDSPVHVTHAGDNSGRLFVVERGGTIATVNGGMVLPTPFLDIADRVSSGGERGLLSVAFAPDFAVTGAFYVYYTDEGGDSVLSRFSASDGQADPQSEQILLTFNQPFSNHNGGQIAFGPDGMLYLASGDGGSGGDPLNNGQSLDTLLGKILRLQVTGKSPGDSLVPADNPLLDNPDAHGEIWAFGLRNPWRISFDFATGDLYIADVGQNTLEEVNVQSAASPGGENYGWNILEGDLCFAEPDCSAAGTVLPVATYGRDLGCSVTGGHVYRGSAYPAMAGIYFYGDFCTGRVFALTENDGQWTSTVAADTDFSISSFGRDQAGNLYLVDLSGALYQITNGAPVNPVTIDAGFTGSWFDPDQSGHGLQIEVLDGNRLAAFWYTFAPEGGQAWFTGVGEIEGDQVTLDMVQTEGGRFIPNFNPDDVTNPPWGAMTIRFFDCNNGEVVYTSTSGFGSGHMRLERLTQPAGLPCSS